MKNTCQAETLSAFGPIKTVNTIRCLDSSRLEAIDISNKKTALLRTLGPHQVQRAVLAEEPKMNFLPDFFLDTWTLLFLVIVLSTMLVATIRT